MTPGDMIGMAMLKGLDVIAVTDHQSCGNCEAAINVSRRLREEGLPAPLVVPGMEAASAEEIHLLCLFASLETALQFQSVIDESLLRRENRPDIFGRQLLFDSHDNLSGEDSRMLLMPVRLSAQQIASEVGRLGGACIPAHIDRESNSMLSTFGLIPEDFAVSRLEISWRTDLDTFYRRYPALREYPIIRSSDAHCLGDIAEPGWKLSLPDGLPRENWLEALISSLR